MRTTISVSQKLKENICDLKQAGESCDDVINRMYEVTRKQILQDHVYDTENSIPIKEAIKQAKQKWPKL
jgi:predicted CopG family antitoxin